MKTPIYESTVLFLLISKEAWIIKLRQIQQGPNSITESHSLHDQLSNRKSLSQKREAKHEAKNRRKITSPCRRHRSYRSPNSEYHPVPLESILTKTTETKSTTTTTESNSEQNLSFFTFSSKPWWRKRCPESRPTSWGPSSSTGALQSCRRGKSLSAISAYLLLLRRRRTDKKPKEVALFAPNHRHKPRRLPSCPDTRSFAEGIARSVDQTGLSAIWRFEWRRLKLVILY